MVADEYGFDPDETKTIPDNPFWDCTDAAHPAWWRGCDYGVEAMVRRVNEWLDAPLEDLSKGAMGDQEVHALRQRILDLRTQHKF